MRDSDITAMDAMGSKLTKKVKTPFHPIAKKFNKDKYFIVIDSMRYNVIYADYDNFISIFILKVWVNMVIDNSKEKERLNKQISAIKTSLEEHFKLKLFQDSVGEDELPDDFNYFILETGEIE